jgi:head-tail adaptor
VVIRFRTDVDETMRIVDGSAIYNIAAPPINTDSRNIELQLMCSKGTGGG